ncbi:MAG: hypothetical protein OXN96_01865 [Bryobacterales bacterium]|nr:hypothetical protein [Bryobacterales bacterium]
MAAFSETAWAARTGGPTGPRETIAAAAAVFWRLDVSGPSVPVRALCAVAMAAAVAFAARELHHAF